MVNNYFIGLQRWTQHELEKIISIYDKRIAGIILGDPFCEYRMFPQGNWSISLLAKSAKEAGKIVVYQTPVYLTHPRFELTVAAIQQLEQQGVCDWILAQDIGLLSWCHNSHLTTPISWSVWGINRSFSISYNFIDFLKSLGIQGLEIQKPEWVEPVRKLGLQIFMRSYAPTVITFRQKCYVETFLNTRCNLGDLCAKPKLQLANKQHELKLNINGFTIEDDRPTEFIKPDIQPDWYTIHVRDFAEFSDVLERAEVK